MKKLYNKFIAISLMLIAEISVVEAQSNENSIEPRIPLAKNYTITNGLPSNEVYQTIQDKKGLIWFCTDKGVVSFNGSKFKVYDKSDGLKENSVLRSKKDENENLWFYTINDFIFKIQDSVYTHPYKKL